MGGSFGGEKVEEGSIFFGSRLEMDLDFGCEHVSCQVSLHNLLKVSFRTAAFTLVSLEKDGQYEFITTSLEYSETPDHHDEGIMMSILQKVSLGYCQW